MNAPNYARLRGPGDFDAPAELEDDVGIEERASELADEYADRADKREQAHEWLDGTMDGEWYSQLERDLAELDRTAPSELIGSDLLERLYRLARPMGTVLMDKIGEMAREDAEAEFARFEANSPDGDA